MERLYYPHILAIFFWSTLYGWLAIGLWMGSRHKPSQTTETGRRSDVLLALAVGLGLLCAIMLKGLLPDTKIYSSPALFWLALLVAWSGIILWLLSIRTLGKFFVTTIITQVDQPVIATGPYRFIRHPSYLADLLTVLGVAVALNNLPGAVLLVTAVSAAILQRIRLEENYLVKKLGEPYQQYTRHTKRLLPFIW